VAECERRGDGGNASHSAKFFREPGTKVRVVERRQANAPPAPHPCGLLLSPAFYAGLLFVPGRSGSSDRLAIPARDLSRLVLRHQAGCCAPSSFVCEIDVGERKIVSIACDVGNAAIFLDGPRWREAAVGHRPIQSSPCAYSKRQNARNDGVRLRWIIPLDIDLNSQLRAESASTPGRAFSM
jgi:hypothetical protein